MNIFNKVFNVIRSNTKVGIRKNSSLVGIKTASGLEVIPIENWDDLARFISSLPFIEVKSIGNEQFNIRRKG